MRVVFNCLQNCSGCKDGHFRADGRDFQHIGPETANAKAQEPNVAVLIHGKSRLPWVAACMWRRVVMDERGTEWRQVSWSPVMLAFVDHRSLEIICWSIGSQCNSLRKLPLRSKHDRTCTVWGQCYINSSVYFTLLHLLCCRLKLKQWRFDNKSCIS